MFGEMHITSDVNSQNLLVVRFMYQSLFLRSEFEKGLSEGGLMSTTFGLQREETLPTRPLDAYCSILERSPLRPAIVLQLKEARDVLCGKSIQGSSPKPQCKPSWIFNSPPMTLSLA